MVIHIQNTNIPTITEHTEMTIPVEPASAIPPYVPAFQFTPNITPFTYRDGLTYLQRMERLVKYINRVVVPFVNENYQGLADAFTTEVNRMIETVNDALAAQDEEVDTKLLEAKAYVDAAVDSIINASVEIQDPLVAQMINDPESETRAALDALLVPIQNELSTISAIINDGRLSQTALDAAYATKSELGVVDDKADSNTAALANKADISTQETVETGRLSSTVLDQRFVDNEKAAIPIKLGGTYPKISQLFVDGMTVPNIDCRVQVLGGNDANAGQIGTYLYHSDQAWVNRLAWRSSGKAPVLGSTVIANVSPAGLQWYNSAKTNGVAADYFGESEKTQLGYIDPHIVIHNIGNQDYKNQTPIVDYQSAVQAACEFVEANSIPGVLNILVHAQPRNDVSAPAISFSQYHNALKAVAALKPTQRVVIDANSYFSPLRLWSDDKQAMLSDVAHLNETGHSFLADIIGTLMGIPSENDYALPAYTRLFPFKNDGSDEIHTSSKTLVSIDIDPARFPREIMFVGLMYAQFGDEATHLILNLHDVDANASAGELGSWPGLEDGSIPVTLPLNASFYMKPGVRYKAEIKLFLNATHTAKIRNNLNYTNGKAIITSV